MGEADLAARCGELHHRAPGEAALEWQAAIKALILVVELGGRTMFARIGMMQALNRHHVRQFDPARKNSSLGQEKAQEGPMSVFVYVNTSKQVGDPEHVPRCSRPWTLPKMVRGKRPGRRRVRVRGSGINRIGRWFSCITGKKIAARSPHCTASLTKLPKSRKARLPVHRDRRPQNDGRCQSGELLRTGAGCCAARRRMLSSG